MIRSVIFVFFLLILSFCPTLGANSMAGAWRASSGYTVHIPDCSGSFTLVFVDIKGEKITHPAQWLTVGKEFTWTDKQNATHNARLDPGNPDRIIDVNSTMPDSTAYWYRIMK